MTPRAPLRVGRPLAATIKPRHSAGIPGRRRGVALFWRVQRPLRAAAAPRLSYAPSWSLSVNLFQSLILGATTTHLRSQPRERDGRGSRAPAGRRSKSAPTATLFQPTGEHFPAVPRPARAYDLIAASFAGRARERTMTEALPRSSPTGLHVGPFGAGRAPQRALPRPIERGGSVLTGPLSSARPQAFPRRVGLAMDVPNASPTLRRAAPSLRAALRRMQAALPSPSVPAEGSVRGLAATLPTRPAPRRRRSPVPLVPAGLRVLQAAAVAAVRASDAHQRIDLVWPGRNGDDAASPIAGSIPGVTARASSTTAPAAPSTPVPNMAAPGLPDLEGLVDEVMRRIDRKVRSERLRRGL